MMQENMNLFIQSMTKAGLLLKEMKQDLKKLIERDNSGDTSSTESGATSIQLILEYRLNALNILSELLELDYHLLYILGIQPQHSANTNLERMAYALGGEDLKAILFALSDMVEALLKVARRYKNHLERSGPKGSQTPSIKSSFVVPALLSLKDKQTAMLLLVQTMQRESMEFLPLEPGTPEYEQMQEIEMTLEHLQQDLQQILSASQELYQKYNETIQLEKSLEEILQQTQTVLQNMPSLYHTMPHYSPSHFKEESLEELEKQAEARRLRPIFWGK
jgi:hypothetical protein